MITESSARARMPVSDSNVARQQQVHALGGGDPKGGRAGHRLHVGRPHPGRVHHHPRPHPERLAGGPVHRVDAGHSVAGAPQPGHLGVADQMRAVAGGGARHGERVPGVVHPAVVVLQRAGDHVPVQPGRFAQRAAPGEVAVVRHTSAPARAPRERHQVVERHAGADVRPFPVPGQREQERLGGHQVRRQGADHQVAFPQRLGDQREVQLL
jgi:hypothetical protein